MSYWEVTIETTLRVDSVQPEVHPAGSEFARFEALRLVSLINGKDIKVKQMNYRTREGSGSSCSRAG